MNRRWLRWGWLLLLVPVIIGLARLRFDVEVLNLLPELPLVHGLKLYQQHFTSTRELILTLRAPDAETAEAAARQLAETLRVETNLVASADWQPPLAEHPEQMAEFIAHLWLNQPPAAFADLTNRLAPAKMEEHLRGVRGQLSTSLSPMDLARLSYDPFGFTRLPETGLGGEPMSGREQEGFASATGNFRLLFVEVQGKLLNYHACEAWVAAIKAVVNRCEKTPGWPGGVTVRFTGAPAFVAEVASGMERDMQGSALCSLVLIVGLFWWAHRSWYPLLCLIAVLGLVVAGTLASGGLIFKELNAVSLGFTAILLGLAVDYGLVLYQEHVAEPQLSVRELRRIHAPGILWSAVTTAVAFGLLNFAGLPGLTQLGSLVGIGVLLAAGLMLFAFLPLIMRRRLAPALANSGSQRKLAAQAGNSANARTETAGLVATALIAVLAALTLWRSWPAMDHSNSPLQPRHNPAQVALLEMQAELNQQGEPFMLVVSGRDEDEVARRLDAAGAHLTRAVANHEARSLKLPTALWPHAERQRANLAAARGLAAQEDAMKTAVSQAGFTDEALALTENLFRIWKQVDATGGAIWPTNRACQWTLKRAVAQNDKGWLAAGAVFPGTNGIAMATLAKLDPEISGVWLSAWPLLGDVLLQHVKHRLVWMVGGMFLMLILCLWLAFHRWTEVALAFVALGFSLLVLLAVMSLAGWSWNMMNLMALPILLGAGVDYSIHIQLALRRHGGDIGAVRRVTGRAVFVCAATTVAGFGSNAFSSNAGLASLGLVCATGIATVYLTEIFLLPAWWRLLCPAAEVGSLQSESHSAIAPGEKTTNVEVRSATPSSFYRAGLWRCGLRIVRMLPDRLVRSVCALVAELHFHLQPRRRVIVVQNLLPPLAGNRLEAEKTARRLYRQFALKLAELWRVENGVPVKDWIAERSELEVIHAARNRGRGVLFVTLHLGNWEHGGLLLADLGIELTVLTRAEPQSELTELRIASRARWGIQTLIIGDDSFAFVDVIKRLQAGAALAISIDRPAERGAAQVELFGKPFSATVAAAELARASGCALIGVTVVRRPEGFAVKVLPEFTYDRQALGDREARRQLTQEILRAFEPEIRKDLDQWYQFVPIWPEYVER